ncbi:MarR family winged helix-turn-helix transcriptional regulator [Rathayibacter sp. KR2-224]|uniref:MarR family winged helix-turn-helix transcriptional regulator n=1 Tax=Rathayibacter sp. KR2-224 TaxID=3400913 RepID=UPI003C0A2A7A
MPQTVVRHESEHLYAAQPETAEGKALTEALLRLRRAEFLLANRALESTGLSSLEFNALRYLVQARRDGRDMSPKDVIVMLNTSSATVTNVIERLVTRGYLTRVSHPSDRRAHYLVPTEPAVHLVDSAYHDHHAAIVDVVNELDAMDLATACAVVNKIVERLDALVESSAASRQTVGAASA